MHDKQITCCNEYSGINWYIKIRKWWVIYDNSWFKESKTSYERRCVNTKKSTIGIVGKHADSMMNDIRNYMTH